MSDHPVDDNLHRCSIRLAGYDYSEEGSYFVTLVTHGRAHLFGRLIDGEMELSAEGSIVQEVWDGLTARYPQIEGDCRIVMPNHFHGIITINENPTVRAIHELPLRGCADREGKEASRIRRRRMLLPLVIGYFKMNSARQINLMRGSAGQPVWQRNYYEHIIMSDEEYATIAAYIQSNPWNWEGKDEYN